MEGTEEQKKRQIYAIKDEGGLLVLLEKKTWRTFHFLE